MPIVDCGRLNCLYNKKNLCTREKIVWRGGHCQSYLGKKEVQDLMEQRKPGCHREKGKYKNNTGRILK